MVVILRFSIFASTLFLNFFKYFFKENHNYLKNKEIKIKKNSKKILTFKKLLKSYKQNDKNKAGDHNISKAFINSVERPIKARC